MAVQAYEKLGAFYLGRQVDATSGQDTAELVLYDSRDLTTHAVCVGMTGSGKTGLCLSLLEEAAIDGVPAIIIDPKGDLGNLLLAFPALRPEDFLPWIDAGDAARKGQTPEAFAAATAETWRRGLAEWQQDGERIARFRDAAEVTIHTPGSKAGRPLSILRSFAPPDAELLHDAAAVKDRLSAAVSGLLGLVGIDADPVKSREHILLSSVLGHVWQAGQSPDLAALIQSVQKPPFDKVGVFDVETFFPAKDRLTLAMAINNLLAAPGFSAWLEGDALDVQQLLFAPSGKPRLSIISIAHLNDAERMFVVTLVLNEIVAWMRRQSGTSSLRALVYMDEIFGYFPPSAMPPSKIPLLTLMKQARAFGVGVVLATQNPVDLDYKGLSNAGTWFIGRLQTERDKARVVDGLLSAGGDGLDKASLESLIANLDSRVFLMRNVHEDEPVLLRTRWALSYLRGPLTLAEISRLSKVDGGQLTVDSGRAAARSQPSTVNRQPSTRPVIPAGVTEYFLRSADDAAAVAYVPYVLGTAQIHFVDSSAGLDAWETRSWRAPLLDDATGPDWSAATVSADLKNDLQATPVPDASFADVPAALLRAQNYASWRKQLGEFIYQSATLDIFRCPMLKTSSAPGGSEGEFRSRIALLLRERRDAGIEKLRRKYAPRLTTLGDQLRRAEDRIERERSQLSQQKMQTAISVGTTLLGALLGRKKLSTTTLGRAGSAARSAGRVSSESQDVARAEESLDTLKQRLADTEAELQQEIGRLQGELDPAVVDVERVPVRPRKADSQVTMLALVWVPVPHAG